MSARDDLIAAKKALHEMPAPKRIQAAHRSACHRSPTALASIVALREALPPPFSSIEQFEGSRLWRLKDAYAVFDRAILAAEPTP